MDTMTPPAALLEIETFDGWTPDLDVCVPNSICMRLEAPER